MSIRYISTFSGIEAATVAWHDLGWDPVVFADIDEFPSAVLAHHYPQIENVGDVMKHEWKQYKGKCELIVGGSPCQSFSVAGHRLGMDDPRGNLALHFLKIVRDIQPKWFVYENVPGLLSSDGGRDFAAFLAEVAKCGYGFAYRVLDAQHFGVPQRRRRVFVVGHIDGDWRSAAAVLFESESLRRDSKASKEKGQNASLFAGSSIDRTVEEVSREEGVMYENHASDARITETGDVSPTVRARFGTGGGNVPLVKQDKGVVHSAEVAPTMTNGNSFPHAATGNARTEHEGLVVQDKGIIHCADVGPAMGASGPPYSRTGNERVEDEALVVQAPMHDPSPTLDASYGVGAGMRAGIERQVIGAAIPIHAKTTSFKGGGDRAKDGTNPNTGVQNGLGVGKEGDPMNTLDTACNHAVFQHEAFTFDAHNSNSMKSPNPHSGVHKTRISPTLDTTDPSPAKYQGGVAVVQQGSAESSFGSFQDSDLSGVLKASGGVLGGGSETLITEGSAGVVTKGNGEAWETEEMHMSLTSGGGQLGQGQPAVRHNHVVRRLTPTECERLQGFPDNYTQIPFKGKEAKDCPQSHRYKALGNSMAVPVMKWIGERIQAVEIITNDIERAEPTVSVQKRLW